MKKNIYQMNQLLTSVKSLTYSKDSDYVRMLWAISHRVYLEAAKGSKNEQAILADVKEFIKMLNNKYPSNEEMEYDYLHTICPATQ